MSTVVIERHFKQSPDIVFSFLSQSDHILKWWGPEGGSVPEHSIDFGRLGPWYAKMMGADGQQYHVSGVVTAVDEPNSIEFSWGWNDENGNRGKESYVRFEVLASEQGGTDFKLSHRDLENDESAQNHMKGWTATIDRLENFVN